MAMRRYGKGDLCGLSVGEESTYGTASTVTEHAGVVRSYDVDLGMEFDEVPDCGKRTMGKRYVSRRDVTATVGFRLGKDVSLADWFERTLGWNPGHTACDLTGNPKSSTVHVKIGPGDHDALVGCAVNKLTLSSEDLGKAVLVTAEMLAKDVRENDPSFAAMGKAISQSTPVRSFQMWTCATASIGTVKSGKWTLTVNQNLQRVAGTDGEITLGSGQEPYLGNPEVTLEITLPATSRAWDLLRYEATDGLSFSTEVGDALITLSGCIIGGNGPSRSEDPYDETVTIIASNITVVKRVEADAL